ncbi:MAG: hypothetical protein FJ291_07410 [Planctomycetes bacterium]|nr:hypothetical protein [Planctomycetota bacterium]
MAELRNAISGSPSLLLPDGFYNSFEFTQTGQNLTHPRTVGLIVKACWALPEVAAVDVDVRFNLGRGCKFQPDAAARTSDGEVILVIDYESPNSSDARIPVKDVGQFIGWARREFHKRGAQPPPYLIITTLPDQPDPGAWWAMWTAEGQYNEGRRKDSDKIRIHPRDYWYDFYRKEVGQLLEQEPWATIHFLNLDGSKLEQVSL